MSERASHAGTAFLGVAGILTALTVLATVVVTLLGAFNVVDMGAIRTDALAYAYVVAVGTFALSPPIWSRRPSVSPARRAKSRRRWPKGARCGGWSGRCTRNWASRDRRTWYGRCCRHTESWSRGFNANDAASRRQPIAAPGRLAVRQLTLTGPHVPLSTLRLALAGCHA